METNQSLNLLERFNHWLRESIMIKLLSIGFLVLILLIPSAWIQNLMEERQERAESVMSEIAEKWSGSQTIAGPILVVPFKHLETYYVDKNKTEVKETTQKAFFLPETLTISGEVNPQLLHRGIFDAAVYESALQINGYFNTPDFKLLNIADDKVLWNEAYFIYSITDLRGISENPGIKVGDQVIVAEPTDNIGVSVREFRNEITRYDREAQEYTNFTTNGIVCKAGWTSKEDFKSNATMKLSLKGSNRLSFVPAGKTTTADMKGPWGDPSFDGEFLPVSREVKDDSFSATWKVLHFNRPFSQQWTENGQKLAGSEFGMKLLIPVDQYQKSIRTSKYGILVILLTFIALFLVEITKKIRIHPFQYILVGAALIIYYTLLLSFSEQIGYNWAYWVSTISTVTLVSAYSASFIKERKLVFLFSMLIVIFYSFIFIIILQQDFSLLIGSLGLFLIVGLLMYFSRKVNWYKETVG